MHLSKTILKYVRSKRENDSDNKSPRAHRKHPESWNGSNTTRCILDYQPCGIHAMQWGHFMLQPYIHREQEKGQQSSDETSFTNNASKVDEAQSELQTLLDHLTSSGKVRRKYHATIFGSAYVYKWWDGFGDVDFTLIPVSNDNHKMKAADVVNIDIEKREEKILLLKIAEVLKLCVGESQRHIYPILHARVPILKHETKSCSSTKAHRLISWAEPNQNVVYNKKEISDLQYPNSIKSAEYICKDDPIIHTRNNCVMPQPPYAVIRLRSFSLTFFSPNVNEYMSNFARIRVEETLLSEMQSRLAKLSVSQEADTRDCLNLNTPLFFLWESSSNTLFVTCHDANPSITKAFLNLFLNLRERKRVGPAPLRAAKSTQSEFHDSILEAISVQIEHKKKYIVKSHTDPKHTCGIRLEFAPYSLFSIDFDLSLRTLGLKNSTLLQKYFNPEPSSNSAALKSEVIKAGALFLKSWSKKSGVNNSAGGMLCTYAINIMWIHFLLYKSYRECPQQAILLLSFIEPGIIEMSANDMKSVSLNQSFCDNNKSSFSLNDGKKGAYYVDKFYADSCHTLGCLITEFFHYYSKIFDWETQVITINRKSETKKSDLRWDCTSELKSTGENQKETSNNRVPRNQKYVVAIEDPYEEGFNLGRNISSSTFQDLKDAFAKQFQQMTEMSPQEVMFRSLSLSENQKRPKSVTEINNFDHTEATRLKKINDKLKFLRQRFYKMQSAKILSRVPNPDGLVEVFPYKLSQEEINELFHLLAATQQTQGSMNKLIRLLMLASFETSVRKPLSDESPLEINFITIESVLVKGLHSAIRNEVFNLKEFNKTFSYLPRAKLPHKGQCSSCAIVQETKYFAKAPFRFHLTDLAKSATYQKVMSLVKK